MSGYRDLWGAIGICSAYRDLWVVLGINRWLYGFVGGYMDLTVVVGKCGCCWDLKLWICW